MSDPRPVLPAREPRIHQNVTVRFRPAPDTGQLEKVARAFLAAQDQDKGRAAS